MLIRKTAWAGALLKLGVIGGAIFIHTTHLGIEAKDDGDLLFTTTGITLIVSSVIAFIYRTDISFLKTLK